MRSYFALQGKKLHVGSWSDSIHWARERVLIDFEPVKIFAVRGGETEARIIAEILPNKETLIKGGRLIKLRDLLSVKNIKQV